MEQRILEGDAWDVLSRLPSNSFHAMVTDPPAGIGFMNKAWDKDKGGRDKWVQWLQGIMIQARRVLKPGGHGLVWALPRTSHWTAMALELAGFEIRDVICHHFGQGMPKGANVSKAIDKRKPKHHPRIYELTAAIRKARDDIGMSNEMLDQVFGFNGTAGHWTSATSQPECPKWKQWLQLKMILEMDDSLDMLVARINAGKGLPGPDWYKREVTGTRGGWKSSTMQFWGQEGGVGQGTTITETLPASDLSVPWEGWHTGLKPSTESWILVRKPLEGTIADNVLAHGVGGLHVDACKIPTDENLNGGRYSNHGPGEGDGSALGSGINIRRPGEYKQPSGRWPPNLLLTHSPDCGEACVDGCPVAEMDKQHPKAGGHGGGTQTNNRHVYGAPPKGTHGKPIPGADKWGKGGGSMYFPRFRYQAKAAPGERRRDMGEGFNNHPTLKPVALMRWLVRLITPPGGEVLDPFAGSGSTLVACHLEGFKGTGVELDPHNVSIVEDRLAHYRGEPCGSSNVAEDREPGGNQTVASPPGHQSEGAVRSESGAGPVVDQRSGR